MKFRDWEVSKVGTKCVDRGHNFLNVSRGRRFRIKGTRRGFSIRGWESLLNVGRAGGRPEWAMVI